MVSVTINEPFCSIDAATGLDSSFTAKAEISTVPVFAVVSLSDLALVGREDFSSGLALSGLVLSLLVLMLYFPQKFYIQDMLKNF
jgi:hypothetical protein